MIPLLVAAALTAPSPESLLDAVYQTYRGAGDIHASFTQTYVGGLRGKKKVETGRLWAKQDGRVRWQYEKPQAKYFIFDGESAYFYEPHNSQVMIFDEFQNSKLSSALKFLMGQGKLGEHFNVFSCETHCGLARKGETVVELTPKEALANVERVALVVDDTTKRVRLSTVFDSLGYRTEYRFEDINFGAKIADAQFEFETPPGVQELRPPVEGT